METFVNLVGARGARKTSIVDAACAVRAAIDVAAADGRVVTHALVSHHHFDHTNGLPDVLARGGIRAHVHARDAEALDAEVRGEVTPVSAGDAIEVGPLKIHAFHTPGHTPGSTCWHA